MGLDKGTKYEVSGTGARRLVNSLIILENSVDTSTDELEEVIIFYGN